MPSRPAVGMPYVNQRWLGGMLTNFRPSKASRASGTRDHGADGTFAKLHEEGAADTHRGEGQAGAVAWRHRGHAPAAGRVLSSTKKEHIAVNEARILGIPVVAIVDTNCDPDEVDYVIPGNDDAIRSAALLTRVVADAVAEGLMTRANATANAGRDGAEADKPEPTGQLDRPVSEERVCVGGIFRPGGPGRDRPEGGSCSPVDWAHGHGGTRAHRPRALVPRALRAGARAARAVHDALGRAGAAALHRGGPARARPDRAARASIRTRAACTRACTAGGCGRCASSPASARPRRPTSASATCSTTARRGCRTAFDMPTPDGPRLRPPALGGRGRARGRRDRHARRHGDAVRRDRPRRGHRLDDDQRAGGDHARVLRRRRGGERRAGRPARRHDPGRHPQGVHRPEGVVLPGRPGDAAARRHDRVVRGAHAALAPGLDLAATTSARRARPPRRSSRSRSRTA